LANANFVMMKLSRDFYTGSDVVNVSKELLGKFLVTSIDGHLTSGMIVETEAYCGRNDKACHANEGRRTKRTEIMFGEGGRAYVYLCYGIHHLFNVTTNADSMADAVLIRGVEPVDGIEQMVRRRNNISVKSKLTAGPGALSQALGITTALYGQDLLGDIIWIEERGIHLKADQIVAGSRVGVEFAGDDALRPWRFAVENSQWVSKPWNWRNSY